MTRSHGGVDIAVSIRAALAVERRRQNLSQSDLAKLLHVGQAWMCALENGYSHDVELATLARWAGALNVRLEVKIRNGRVEAWVLPLEVAAVN